MDNNTISRGSGSGSQIATQRAQAASMADVSQSVAYDSKTRFGAGAWAALLALAAGFVGSAFAQVPPPLEPLTEAVMQATPVTIANALLTTLGSAAPPLGLLGAAAICLPIGGVAALVAPAQRARPTGDGVRWIGRWGALMALSCALSMPLAVAADYPAEAVAALVVGVTFAPALWVILPWYARLTCPHRGEEAVRRPAAHKLSRRTLLARVGDSAVVLTGFAVLASFSSWSRAIGAALGRPEVIRRLFAFQAPGPRAPGFPVAGMEPEVSPVDAFYVVSKNAVDPVVDPASYLLRVTGLVERPLTLTYSELLALPRVDQYVTLRCVDSLPGSHLMSNAYWSGVSLAGLLRRAGIRPQAGTIVTHAPDGYAETTPLAVALEPSTLLAYAMNGETLSRRHGGPVRLVAPGFFGFKNVKWVEEVEVTAAGARGYWADHEWTAARVHAVARIDVWRKVVDGVLLAGVAYTGADGVSAVQVSVDGQGWGDEGLVLNVPALSKKAWVQWRATMRLTAGAHTVAARVVDAEGRTQPPGNGAIFPDGATGYDTVSFTL